MKRKLKRLTAILLAMMLVFSMSSQTIIYAAQGSIKTTESDGIRVNGNVEYASKQDVYLSADKLDEGDYYIKVTNPGGNIILGESSSAVLKVKADGTFDTTNSAYQIYAYTSFNDSPIGEYKVTISKNPDYTTNFTDNFKVKEDTEPTPWSGNIKVNKIVVDSQNENPSEAGFIFSLYKGETKVDELTTGENGTVTFNDLGEGTYTLYEENATGYTSSIPDGMSITLPGNIATGGTLAETVTNTKIYEPTPWSGSIEVNKVVVDSQNENPSEAGFIFSLYKGETKVDELTTGENGKVTFTDLGEGNYTLYEENATGYTSSIPDGMNITLPGEVATGGTLAVTVTNTKIYEPTPWSGNIEVNKTVIDSQNENPSKAGFTFTLKQGTTTVGEGTTNADGKVTFSNLAAGTYTLFETVISGYTMGIGADGMTITLPGNVATGGTLVVPVTNTKIYEPTPWSGNIEVNKTVIDSQNQNPSKAGFTFVLNKGETKVGEGTTDTDGKVTFSNLAAGTYTLFETVISGYTMGIGADGMTITLPGNVATGGTLVVPVTNTKVFTPNPSFTIEKSVTPDEQYRGKDVTYSVKLTNTGNVVLNGIEVVDNMSIAGGFTQTINLGIDESKTIPYTFTIPESFVGTWIENNVTATWGEITKTAYADVYVIPEISFDITKSVTPSTAKAGDTVTFIITIKNNSTAYNPPAVRAPLLQNNVTITDPLFESADISGWPKYLSLVPGESEAFEQNYTIPDDYTDSTLINTAIASWLDYREDSVKAIATATVVIKKDEPTPTKNPSVNIIKTVNRSSQYRGEDVEYTITVINDGNVALNNITVSDPVFGTGWTKEINLGIGESKTYTQTYSIPSNYSGSTFTNTAIAQWEYNEKLYSDNSSVSVSVRTYNPPTDRDDEDDDDTPTPKPPTPPTPEVVVVPTEPTPAGPPVVVPPVVVPEVVEPEVVVPVEVVPQGEPTMPKTGEEIPYILYSLGSLAIASGLTLMGKKKSK